jgi:hypothetical protein
MPAQTLLWAACSFWSARSLTVSHAEIGPFLVYGLMTLNIASHFEYVLHRFVLHSALATVHARHHALPHKRALMHTPMVMVIAVIAMAYACVVALFPTKMRAVSLTVGPLYYLTFEFLHAKAHQSGYMCWLDASGTGYHKQHHVSPASNYGTISPLWDCAYGTLSRRTLLSFQSRMLCALQMTSILVFAIWHV